MKNKQVLFFYIVSFIEGGMMLFTELASSRKISVFFGGSLYIWLVILCITLSGLAAGYLWASKKISTKDKDIKILSRLFFVLALALIIWKFNNNIALWLIHNNFELIVATVIDAIILLFVPMFIYGAVTTFIVSILQQITSSSSVYANVLALSTIGSIVFGILSVLLFFPYVGINFSVISFAIVSMILGILIYKANVLLVVLVTLLSIIPTKKIRGNILYQNDGAFSSVIVMDNDKTRYLMVNHIIQSFIDKKNSKTMDYVELIDSIAKIQNWKDKKMLILGLGGGIVGNKMIPYTKEIVGVEIDPRIIECAKKYFNLDSKIKTVCADAQWYLHKENNKYDIIIMDLFNGEEPPAYLLTIENFQKIKTLLNDDNSLLIINWYGYYSSTSGKGTRILANTLHQSGFYSAYISTNNKEGRSNIVIFTSTNKSILPSGNINVQLDDNINTYDRNILSLFNAKANYNWRRDYLQFVQYWWR